LENIDVVNRGGMLGLAVKLETFELAGEMFGLGGGEETLLERFLGRLRGWRRQRDGEGPAVFK
jgi:hypothetical protein